MKYATKKNAREILELIKEQDSTNYFNGHVSMNEIYDMLRNRMRFGSAETYVIIAALVLAGAKFKADNAE